MNELARTYGVHVTDPNLPSELQNVYNLVESILTTSPEIFAAFSMIHLNHGLRDSFDKIVAQLITSEPKKKYTKKQTTANIGAVEVNNGIGETGVHLRFHTGSEFYRLTVAQRADLHNQRHSSSGKRSATGYPEGGGRGRYGGRGEQGGRGRGIVGRGRGRGRSRGKFESQVAAMISKTTKNEANKLTNALETVAAADSAVNGYLPGIPPTVPPAAKNLVVSAAEARKQQATEKGLQ